MRRRYITSKEAIKELGISSSTLYSYVSRGLIRSYADSKDPRARKYLASEVQSLKRKKAVTKSPKKAVASALHLGMPLLSSKITEIRDNTIYYRGYDVVELAKAHSFEAVSSLLWRGELTPISFPPCHLVAKANSLPELQVAILNSFHDEGDVLDQAEALMSFISAAITGVSEGDIAYRVVKAWCPYHPYARELIESALILSADHELNVSSFTARCVASARASLSASIVAALSAFRGDGHGAATTAIEDLLIELKVEEIVNREPRSLGFGHPIYPEGDPRAKVLLDHLHDLTPRDPSVERFQRIRKEVEARSGEEPGWEYALAVLGRVLGLGRGASTLLFAIGRTAGWIAHVLEQYGEKEMIRPRAGRQ